MSPNGCWGTCGDYGKDIKKAAKTRALLLSVFYYEKNETGEMI